MLIFRKATEREIDLIEEIYFAVHTDEESGRSQIGWVRGVYPTRQTAQMAYKRGDLFVADDDGEIVGSAIINKEQVSEYKYGAWQNDADNDKVMVLHTLVIAPSASGRGYGKKFVEFYEQYAKEHKCPFLRMDTNEKNLRARALYKKLGYSEIGVVPCNFNGINGISLVLLEKKL